MSRRLLLLFLIGLSACSSKYGTMDSNTGRYSMSQDAAPQGEISAKDLKSLAIYYEPQGQAGNKSPYTVKVNGRSYTYKVLPSSEGYVDEGIASWYGAKFHGHLTSNGEIFDMYVPTAAHKTLPLPSYARVTNLENGKSIIVRINDRGPFHQDRLIDLSYAAAIQLDYAAKGTAKVRIEALAMKEIDREVYLLQVAALSDKQAAEDMRDQLDKALGRGVDVRMERYQQLYRIRIGPMNWQQMEKIKAELNNLNYRDLLTINTVKG